MRMGVAPIQAFLVPNGCSTVHGRSRIAYGIWSSLFCMASRTPSCSQRVIRGILAGVYCALIEHSGHLVVQMCRSPLPFSSLRLNHYFIVSPAGHR